MDKWTVVSINTDFPFHNPYIAALFNSLDDAIEYVKWVYEYDAAEYSNWLTYIVQGDYFYAPKS